MRLIMVVMLVALTGCTTVQISNYIKAENPYIRRVYGNFDQVTVAVRKVLIQEKFKIEKETAPDVYERDQRFEAKDAKGLLIFTDVKQYSRIAYSQYVHLNVYLHALADSTEVEIRFGKVNSVLFSKLKGYRNDRYVQQLLDRIEAQVNQ